MAKLVEVMAKIKLPHGAQGARVRLKYESAYVADARIAGGSEDGMCFAIPGEPGWYDVRDVDGTPLRVYAGEEGDRVPPYVTLKVRPFGAVDFARVDWEWRARPHVNVGEFGWNLMDLGDDPNSGPLIITGEKIASLRELEASVRDSQQRVEDLYSLLLTERVSFERLSQGFALSLAQSQALANDLQGRIDSLVLLQDMGAAYDAVTNVASFWAAAEGWAVYPVPYEGEQIIDVVDPDAPLQFTEYAYTDAGGAFNEGDLDIEFDDQLFTMTESDGEVVITRGA